MAPHIWSRLSSQRHQEKHGLMGRNVDKVQVCEVEAQEKVEALDWNNGIGTEPDESG